MRNLDLQLQAIVRAMNVPVKETSVVQVCPSCGGRLEAWMTKEGRRIRCVTQGCVRWRA